MEFRDAVKYLRNELGFTQIDLANALHVTTVTIGRWENGRNLPSRVFTAALMSLAQTKGVSHDCLEILKSSIANAEKEKFNASGDVLSSVEHASLRQLIDDASFPIYVCDMETDEILYLNQKAYAMVGSDEAVIGKPCYECLMHQDAPCAFCHKDQLLDDRFICYEAKRAFDDVIYKVQGKRIRWNGRNAHVRYITEADMGDHLKSIIDNMNGGVTAIVYDENGAVHHAYRNKRYLEMFGYTAEQFEAELKVPYAIVVPEDIDHVRSVMDQIRATGQPATLRYRAKTRDGSVKHMSCSSSLLSIEGFGDNVVLSVMTDISSAVEAEQRTLALGHRLDAVMKNTSNAVTAVVLGNDGAVDFLFSNELYHEMLGYTKEQYQNEVPDPFRLVYPDDVDKVRRMVMQTNQVGDTATMPYRVVCRDGQVKWLRAKLSVVTFPDEDRPVQLAIYTDITDMMEAIEQIQAQKDEINNMLNTTPSGIAVVEVDPEDMPGSLHTTFYNDRFFSFSGYTREEYDAQLRSNEMSFVFEEDAPVLLANTKAICEGDIGNAVDTTVRCHTKGGGYRWMLFTGQLADRRGGVCVIKISLVDVTARMEAEDKRRISEEMLRIAAETDKRAIVLYDVKTNACHVESRNLFCAKYGECIENIPQSLIDLGIAEPGSIQELVSLFDRIRSGEERISVSLQLRTGAAEYQWFECNAAVVLDADKKPDHAVLVFHNITEQRVKEAVFKKWQQSIETRPPESYTLFRCNLSRDASLDQRDGSLLQVTFMTESMSFNDRTKEYAEKFVYPEDIEAYRALLDSDNLLSMFYRGEHSATMEYREIDVGGNERWRKLTVEMVEYIGSTDVQAFLMYEDIDKEKKAALKAQELAETDLLTGVLNRAAFAGKVDHSLESHPSRQQALLMLDLDGFKQVNDAFGHAAGDQALIDTTAVIRSLLGEKDLVCRLGGDDFLVFLHDIPYDAVIEKRAKMICDLTRKTFSQEVHISASIGISVYPRDGRNFDELYHKADKALYHVKNAGKDSFAFFSAGEELQTHGAVEESPLVPEVARPVPPAKRRMLIVDDSETNRIALGGVFKSDFHIELARNGSEAMIQLRHFGSSIAIVLLDLMMPGMNGYEVLQRMQQNAELRTIPVIVVSADDDVQSSLKAIELGAADYVPKPVDFNLIRLRVKSAISKADNERLRAQNSYLQLQRNEELKFHTVLDSTGTVVVEYDWRNHVFIYDDTITKYIAGDYNNRSIWSVFLTDLVADSADVKTLQEMLHGLANERKKSQASKLVLLKTPQKAKHWFRVNMYKQVDAFGLADKIIITFNDVHEEVLANEKLRYQATRDELTGLYNRSGFIEKAAELIAAREPGYYILSSLDIERFKVINDQYGTKKGDEVLCGFARVINEALKYGESVCCRVMADNFAILYPKSLLRSGKLVDMHRASELLDGSLPRLKVYIGRCVVDDPSLSVSALLDRATMAKETVKGRYDEYIATYDESMRTGILRQQKIIGQMNHALTSGQFEVWLQPQFNHSNGMLCGAEALVRWHHPEDGLIPPNEFIPIFERNGFVYEVDKFVWESCCKTLRRWLDNGIDPVPISVNISRYDVFRADLIDVIQGFIQKYALSVDLLRLEITESAFSESAEQIIRVVKQFVSLGFTVEIDDFGSGYSSLNTLKDVPAQVIKMDMRFFENTSDSQRGGSIVESVVRMSRWLGMAVIAEGVEKAEQADYLKSIGCDTIQGYLYSKPLPQSEYEALLLSRKKESQLHGMQTLKAWNNNAFWDPKSMETLIFNSIVGGACIFEYQNGKTELLRANDRYAQELGAFGRDNVSLHQASLVRFLDEDNLAVMGDNIRKAIETKKESVCELRLTQPLGSSDHTEYIRATVRAIAQAEDRYLFYEVIYNITEQREAERKQIESAQRLEIIMGNINGGVSAQNISEDGHCEVIFANDRYFEIFGYTGEQARKESLDVMSLILPEDLEPVMEQIRKLKRDRIPIAIDYRCKRLDGRIVYLRENCSLMRMDGYGDQVIASVVSDITEQRELNDKFKAVVDNINGGVSATYLREGKPKYVIINDRYYDIIGYTREQFEAEVANAFDLVHPDDRARVEAQFREAASHEGQYTMEYRFIRRDGAVRHILCNTNVLHLFGVEEPVQLAVSNDITDLRQAQQKIIESAGKLQAVLDHAGNGMTAVALYADQPALLFANKKYYEIIGYTEEAYEKSVAHDVFAIIHPDDRDAVRAKTTEITEKDGSVSIDYRVRKADGAVAWIRSTLTLTAMTGVDVPVQIAVFSDITEEVNANEQLRFLNDTAHDILAQPDCEQALHDTLNRLMEYFGASRGYVVELDLEKHVSYNTYEVCADGVSSEQAHLQGIPFGPNDYWYAALAKHEYFIIDDVDRLGGDEAELKRMLTAQGIRSIIIAGLWKEGRQIGFVGVDNPTKATDRLNRLTALSDYIAILLTRRDLLLNIERDAKSMKQLVDDTPGGFCRMEIHSHANPTLVTFNDGLCRMMDMTGDELWRAYGSDMYKCLNAEDIASSADDSKDALFDGGQFSTKCRLRKKDGGFIWVMVFGRFVSGSDGKTYLNSYFTDITGQLKAEELQKELLDNLPGGAALYEYDGETMSAIHINKRYWQLVEREPVNYYRASVLGVIHPEDLPLVHQEIAASIRQRREVSINLRIRCGESEYRPFHVAATITPEENGKYLFYASYTPITAQSMSIQEMIPIALSTVMSTSSNISYVKDRDMRYICCSRSLVELLGLESERDVIGKSAGELFAPEYADRFDADDRAILASGKPVIDARESIPTADHEILLMQTSKYPILDASGQVIGVYCMSIDITAQREKESQLELLTNSIPGGLAAYLLTDQGPRVLFFNDGFYAFSGCSREEYAKAAQESAFAFVFEEDKPIIEAVVKDYMEHKVDGRTGECVFRCHTKSGGYRWLNMKTVLSQTGQERFVINAVLLDITQQKEAENRRKELLDNLPCGAALYAFDGKSIRAVHINKQYEKMTGRRTNSANTQRSPLDFIHPNDRQVVLTEILDAMRNKREAVCDIRILCGEDTYRTFRVHAHILAQPDRTYSLYATYSAISEQELTFREMVPFIFSTIMESSTDLAFAKDRDFRYLCCSKSFAEFLGLGSEENVIGKTDYELFPKDIADRFRRDDSQLLATGRPIIDLVESIPRHDGRLNYTRMSKHLLRNTVGEVIGLYGNGRDITDSKEAYEQLKLMTNSIPGGLASFACSPEKVRLTYCNDGFCKLFDVTRESYENDTFGNPIHYVVEEDRSILANQYHALMRDGTPIDCIYRIRTKDGTRRWIHHRALVSGRHNETVFVSAALLDITAQQEEKEQLALREEEYRLATRHSGRIICRYSIADHAITITPETAKGLGLPECLEDVPYGRVKLGSISPDTADAYIAFYEAITHGEKEKTAVFQKLMPAGWRWLSAHATTIFAENGTPVSAIISYVDVTEEQEKEAVYKKWNQALRDRKDESYTLFRCNLNKDASYDTREGTLLAHWADADATKSFNELTLGFASQCVMIDDRDMYTRFVNSDAMLASYHRGKRAESLDFRGILANGDIHWLRLSVELVGVPHYTDVEAYMMYENIDQQKQAELNTRQMAETDPLTGLLNRKTFSQRTNELIQKHGPNARHAFVMLDVDGFKMLNDTFGHAAGDEALIEISRKLQALLRQGDLLARLGGDEFVLFLENISPLEVIEKKARQICAALYKSYSTEVSISTSVGIALYPQDGMDCHTLYENADMALYAAKENGRNTFVFYNNAMSARRSPTEIDDCGRAAKPAAAAVKRRMLIVDDNALDRKLLSHLFEKEFIVDFALDGASALTRMRYYGSALSIVLLDLFMQGMTGYEVLERARKSPEMHTVPIIVVSADDNRETSLQAIRAGATDFINKPVEPELIRLRVDAAISRAENERLRAQNSYLEFLGGETAKYQAVLSQLGMAVVELDWVKGTFVYDASISQFIKGNYDNRTLWRILLSDMVAEAKDVQKIQAFIHSLADDRSRSSDSMEVQLRAPSNAKHWFTLSATKLTNDAGLTKKLVLTFQDKDAGPK